MQKSKALYLIFLLTTTAQAGWRESIIEEARIHYSKKSEEVLRKPLVIQVVENNSVSASADYGFNEVKVDLYTGLLKSPRLTPDSLRMTICHELAHLFGGEPKKNIPPEWEGPINENGMSYLSAEGQADYYAGVECFRKLAPNATVQRISKAGLQFLNLVMDFPISIDTPDLSVTPVLIRDSYPSRQCRLDTIIAGAKKLPRPVCWFK